MEHHQSLMREENLYIQTLEMNMRHLSRKHKLIEWIVWAQMSRINTNRIKEAMTEISSNGEG